MEIKLSRYGISDAIDKTRFLSSQIKTMSENIVEILVHEGTTAGRQFNSSAPQSTVQKSEVVGEVSEGGKSGKIALVGPGAIYDEFGTGEEGLHNPHPMKETVTPSLQPYNSGPYVSTHINKKNGKHYWYYRPLGGSPYYKESGYTTGIPAGLQMYNTANYIREQKNNLISKEVKNALRVFK